MGGYKDAEIAGGAALGAAPQTQSDEGFDDAVL